MRMSAGLWRNDSGWAPMARAALAPASLLYRAVTGLRNTMALAVERP